MRTERKPVDVLRAMEEGADFLDNIDGEAGDELREAQDAVAELIAAARDLAEVSAIALQLGVIPPNADGPLPRTLAALARVGGAA